MASYVTLLLTLYTSRHGANKDTLLGCYPTEVQAAIACDDAVRQTASTAPATANSRSNNVDDQANVDAAVMASSETSTEPSTELLSSLNFTSDEEAQRRLDAVTMFEAGFNPEDGSLVEPSLVVMMGEGSELRRLKEPEEDVSSKTLLAAGQENGGRCGEHVESHGDR